VSKTLGIVKGQHGPHEIGRGHETVGILMVFVDADAINARTIGRLELIEVFPVA
jgi:hypothetical protein